MHNSSIATPSQPEQDTLQARMEAVMNYERARPFELLCALAYMSGRSMAELLCTGEFKQHEKELTSFSICVLFRLMTGTADSACYKVNLL